MTECDYTFELFPGIKTRHVAGSYDQKKGTPRYTIDAMVPSDAISLISISQFLMGKDGNRIWVWDIKNNSTWPAFIVVKKDGLLMKSAG